MTAEDDRRHMAVAIALGARGLGQVWPNPAVGCIIVREGRVVGRGRTQPGGRPHAEVMALAMAGRAARGATVYVSLEPCAHHGKTPPCAEALIGAGVARVVTAIEDPDPRVSGRGHAMLKTAGIAVETGVLADAARAAQKGFLSRVTNGRPMVTLKLATTVDGRIATGAGESRWITGPEARRLVHALRLRHDAVMIGAGTARADDPMLDVRDMGPVRQPVRIVAARALEFPLGGRLSRTAREVPLWLMHGPSVEHTRRAAWEAAGARLFAVPVTEGQIDLSAALGVLGTAGLTRILCEGGGHIAAGLLRAGLVDELALFTAGRMIGADGLAAVAALSVARLADAPCFRLTETRALGGDIFSHWVADQRQSQD